MRVHGPLPLASVLLLTAGVAEALQNIHGAGVVHRDLKPSNVLLAADGPRVIDFGIARAADATSLTGSGMRIGTPGFMSPEQARGDSATPASDLFALGLLTHYAATGVNPFGEGAPAAMLYRIVNEEPELSGAPDGLRELIGRCLAKEPADRPGAGEVIETCRRLSGDTSLRRQENWLPPPVTAEITTRTQQPPPPLPAPAPPPHPDAPAGRAETARSARTVLAVLLVAAALLLGVLGGRLLPGGSDGGDRAGPDPADTDPAGENDDGRNGDDRDDGGEDDGAGGEDAGSDGSGDDAEPAASSSPSAPDGDRAPTPTAEESHPDPDPGYVLAESNVPLTIAAPRFDGYCRKSEITRVDLEGLTVDNSGALTEEEAHISYRFCSHRDADWGIVTHVGTRMGTLDEAEPTAEECRDAARRRPLPTPITREQIQTDSVLTEGMNVCLETPEGTVVLMRIDAVRPMPDNDDMRTYETLATQWLPGG